MRALRAPDIVDMTSVLLKDMVYYKFMKNNLIVSGLAMNEDDLKLILVYPPFRGFPTDEFFIQAFNDIYPYVEAVSVMTYDFSSPQKPGKNIAIYTILM